MWHAIKVLPRKIYRDDFEIKAQIMDTEVYLN